MQALEIDSYRGEASQDLLDVMDKYLSLSGQIKELEQQKKALSKQIGTAIEDAPKQRFEHLAGGVAFVIRNRITYTYSPSIAGIEAQLKAEKQAEIDAGIAAVKNHTWFVTTERLQRQG